jgi:hypothetical protein
MLEEGLYLRPLSSVDMFLILLFILHLNLHQILIQEILRNEYDKGVSAGAG